MSGSENNAPVVYILHGDAGVRTLLGQMLEHAGQAARAFACVDAFVRKDCPSRNTCMILDPQLDGCGLAVQERLAERGMQPPLIFMGHREQVQVPTAVRAMKAGAIDFLTWPLTGDELMPSVARALSVDLRQRERDEAQASVQQRFDALTRRETQIFTLVVTGLMNKQMADRLSLSEASIKIHRGNVMRKMGARTLVDLVHMHGLLS